MRKGSKQFLTLREKIKGLPQKSLGPEACEDDSCRGLLHNMALNYVSALNIFKLSIGSLCYMIVSGKWKIQLNCRDVFIT